MRRTAWQVGRELVQKIYFLTKKPEFTNDRRLTSQLQAAAISVPSNIAEGYERVSAAEFHKFLIMAKASCAEVRSQLYNAKDIGYISEVEFKNLIDFAEYAGRIIGALREAVRRRFRICYGFIARAPLLIAPFITEIHFWPRRFPAGAGGID